MIREIPEDEFRNLPPKLKALALSNFTIDLEKKKISISERVKKPAKVLNTQGPNHIHEFCELVTKEDLVTHLIRTQKSSDPSIGSTLFWVGLGTHDRKGFDQTLNPDATALDIIVYTEIQKSDIYSMKKELARMNGPGYATDKFRESVIKSSE